MKHKYVIIDSSKENHNSVDAKFKVQIPQGITGTTRVCVKSFSMPNSYHNIYGDLKTVKFVEFYRPTSGGDWVYEVFSFNLKEGYTETDNLFSEIQSKFTNASGNEITRESDGSTTVQHIGETDTPTIVSVSHNSSNYLNSLSFDSGTQDKVIGLYVDDQNKHTIWESLGFDKRRIVKQTDLVDIQTELNALPPGASASYIQSALRVDQTAFLRGCNSSVEAEYRTPCLLTLEPTKTTTVYTSPPRRSATTRWSPVPWMIPRWWRTRPMCFSSSTTMFPGSRTCLSHRGSHVECSHQKLSQLF